MVQKLSDPKDAVIYSTNFSRFHHFRNECVQSRQCINLAVGEGRETGEISSTAKVFVL